MYAEIIAIGDEITSGQTLDSNSQWLSRRLEALGVRTLYHTTVGDELAPCVEVFRSAIDRAEVVVATGGLGPTADDLTREALARTTGRSLELDSKVLEGIRARFARRNQPMPRQNELQAMFPAGSRVVRNPHGTAPGIDLEVAREPRGPCRVICLPGVPAEMVEMWNDSVAATITGFVGAERRVIRRRQIHCFGAGESQIEAMLPEMIRRGRRPTVGITASQTTITLRIAADGATEEECFEAMAPTAATICQCLGTLVFGEEDEQLQHAVVRLLRKNKKTLATAECGVSSLVAQWLSSIDDAGDAYRGGLVLTEGEESVETMAQRCREQFGADFGLAILLPSPDQPSVGARRGTGGEGGKPLMASFALASSDGIQQQQFPTSWHLSLSHNYTAKHALNLVRLALIA